MDDNLTALAAEVDAVEAAFDERLREKVAKDERFTGTFVRIIETVVRLAVGGDPRLDFVVRIIAAMGDEQASAAAVAALRVAEVGIYYGTESEQFRWLYNSLLFMALASDGVDPEAMRDEYFNEDAGG